MAEQAYHEKESCSHYNFSPFIEEQEKSYMGNVMSCRNTWDYIIFQVVTHGIVFHMLALGDFIICMMDHNIFKLIAFTSSRQPSANNDDSRFILHN